MAGKKGVFVYRPLMPESQETLRPMQERLRRAVRTFLPVPDLHATLQRQSPTKDLPLRALRKLIHPLPETAAHPWRIAVTGLIIERSNNGTAYTLTLDPEDTVVPAEQSLFAARYAEIMNKAVALVPRPHITLGWVKAGERATEDTLAKAGMPPRTVLLGSATCEPPIPPLVKHQPVNYQPPPFDPPRRLTGKSIPAGFLASLRVPRPEPGDPGMGPPDIPSE